MSASPILVAAAILISSDSRDLKWLDFGVEFSQIDLVSERALHTRLPNADYWQYVTDLGWKGFNESRGVFAGNYFKLVSNSLPQKNIHVEWDKTQYRFLTTIDQPRKTAICSESPGHYYRGHDVFFQKGSKAQLAVIDGSAAFAFGDRTDGFVFCLGSVTFTGTEKRRPGTSFLVRGFYFIDGDCQFTNTIDGDAMLASCVIIRGDFHCPSTLSMTHLCCQGNIYLPENCKILNSTIRCGGQIIANKKYRVVESSVESSLKDPLKPFRFFELNQPGMGLEVAIENGTVRVKKVADDSPFRDHLRIGDALVSVDGKPVKTPDELRRAVRTAYVVGRGQFTRLRGGQPSEFVVRFAPPWEAKR